MHILSKERRGRMFIEKEDQVFLMIRTFIHIAIFNLLLAIVIYAPSGENPLRLSEAQRFTNSFIFYHMNKIWWLPLILTVVGFITIIGSHSIVGPVVRFKDVLASALQRDLTGSLHLRKGDHFTDLADLLREELALFSGDFAFLKDKSRQALERLEDLENSPVKEDVRRALEEIHAAAAAYKLANREASPASGN